MNWETGLERLHEVYSITTLSSEFEIETQAARLLGIASHPGPGRRELMWVNT